MIRWNALLRRNVAEYSFSLVIVAALSTVSFFLHSDEMSMSLSKVERNGIFQQTANGFIGR